jgi:hypothetical protein
MKSIQNKVGEKLDKMKKVPRPETEALRMMQQETTII